MRQFLTAILLLLAVLPGTGGVRRVHTIGDSTMANYPTDGSTDKRGWGQMLQQFFDLGATAVNNRGKSGASSKSFYKEAAYWPTLRTGGSDAMQQGDYLLIQFAHNDEKNGGADGDTVRQYYTAIGDAATAAATDYRGTTASGTYKDYIRHYIDEAKAMGVKPIVVGPICRKYFATDGSAIRRNGQHDLGDNFTLCDGTTLTTGNHVGQDDDICDYVAQARAVAAEYADVPFLDLTSATASLYLSYGEPYCTANLFCKDDATHTSALGATLIARTFAQLLKDQAGSEPEAARRAVLMDLAADVLVSSEITFNPASGDMGHAYQGQQIVRQWNVSAFALPEGAQMTVAATAPFQVSTDKVNYSDSATLPSDGGTVVATIYVRATLTVPGRTTGTLTATAAGLTAQLPLTAEAISLSGGESATALWPLSASPSPDASPLLIVADETLSGLRVQQYANIGSGSDARPMQLLTTPSGKWGAGEIDEVSTRYAEFRLTVPADYSFDATRISCNVAARGGSAVSYHAYYSTHSDFSDARLIDEKVNMAKDTPTPISCELSERIEEGGSLYLRFYPWYNGQQAEASGKYFCLSDVAVEGTATKAGGQAVDMAGTITYALADSDPAFDPEAMTVGFAGKTMAVGGLLTLTPGGGTTWRGSTDDGATQTKLANTSGTTLPATAVAGNTLSFTLTPEDGIVFMPSRVSFRAARYGTDSGTITAKLSADNQQTICEGAPINRSGKGLELTTLSGAVDGIAADAAHPLRLDISVLGLGAGKSIGINDIVVEGRMQGTIQQSVKHTLTVAVAPADGGTVAQEPMMPAYKEGTVVALTATRAFGYRFKGWQVDGNDAGSGETLSITMDADKAVVALFEPVPVYTVTTRATNDDGRPLGSVALAPDDHNGRYEAGETITATAKESPVLRFVRWTDGFANAQAPATRTLAVEGDMELTAHYEVQDFIAVFDASAVQGYAFNSTYPFGADLAWDEARQASCRFVRTDTGEPLLGDASGTPVVRNRTAAVLPTINGLYQNGYDLRQTAFEYQFSTAGFTSANFAGDMAAKNAAARSYAAQWSADGSTFADIATWNVAANVQCPVSFDLPQAAMGLEKVWVRIAGRGDELLSSAYDFAPDASGLNTTTHSEAGVGNVYITGEAIVEADSVAPQVAYTTPAQGAAGVPANGTITISFDERIAEGDTSEPATLGGTPLRPTWNTRSVSFPYHSLDYGRAYAFRLPAGYVADHSGNAAPEVALEFTVMDRERPEARIFDAVVDASLQLPQGAHTDATPTMPRQYRYIQDAIDDAPANAAQPYLIYIKAGYYADPNTTFNDSYGLRYTQPGDPASTDTERIPGGRNQYDECRLVCIDKPNIHLIGQATDSVTIATDRLDGGDRNDRSLVWYHVNAGAALEVQAAATGFFMQGITLDNENWTMKRKEGPQALAMNVMADRAVFDQVRARSYQDTYKSNGVYNRQYWQRSTIDGGVDFIYGDGDVWFEGCTLNINRPAGGYIVAPNHSEATRWGYVFNNTRITTTYASDPEAYQVYLGRPWHGTPVTVFLHTRMEVKPYKGYWYPTMGGLPRLWAVYDITDKNGNALSEESISEYYYMDGGNRVEGTAKNSLTDDEAAAYTLAAAMAGDGTADTQTGAWNPLGVVEPTAVPEPTAQGTTATWEADPYAICYVVSEDGRTVAFTTEPSYTGHDGASITVQSANAHGALSAPSEAVVLGATDGIRSVANAANAANARTKAIYSLSGQRLAALPRHGVAIVGGRKVVR